MKPNTKSPACVLVPATLLLAALSPAAEPSTGRDSAASASSRNVEVFAHAEDGTPLTWKVFLPPGEGKRPVVLLIHGGGFTRDPTSPNAQMAAREISAAGHVVFEINYRLAPPGKLPEQKSEGRFPDQTNDVHLAVRAARRDPRGNGQVGGVGGSAGGYHVAWAALTGKPGDDQLDVGVCLSGAYALADAESHRQNPNFKAKVLNYAGPNSPEKLRAASPVEHVTAAAPPLFLIQSQRESMPFPQMPALTAKLQSLPVATVQQQLLLPGGRHSWSYWPDIKDQAIAFLKAGFSRKPPGAGADEDPEAKRDVGRRQRTRR